MTLEQITNKIRDGLTVLAALGFIGSSILFMSNHPYITSKVAVMAGIPELNKQLQETNATIESILKKVDQINTSVDLSNDPAMIFTLDGNTITDGDIGELVVFDISYKQLKNCGRPFIIAGFKNGKEIIHTFINLSVADNNSRSFASPARPDEILKRRFTARIPDNSGVQYGKAVGWVELGPYPNCPNAPTVFSPRIPFNIIPSVNSSERENIR